MINKPLTMDNIFISSTLVDRKAIVVEGKDDIKKYEYIFENSTNAKDKILSKVLKIYAVETIDNGGGKFYVAGCQGVLDAMEDINSNSHHNPIELSKHILGIIDKDVRNHRTHIEAVPQYSTLFILPHYSIESFYVNKCSAKILLDSFLECSKTLITSNLVDWIYENSLINTFEVLYYPILDSLKNATDISYTNSKYSFDMDYGRIKYNADLLDGTEKLDLDSMGVNKGISTYLDICKGKWFFECWLDNVINNIISLSGECGKNIPKCDFCHSGISNKCSYKSVVDSNNINPMYYQMIFQKQDFNNSSYDFHEVISRFDQMFI